METGRPRVTLVLFCASCGGWGRVAYLLTVVDHRTDALCSAQCLAVHAAALELEDDRKRIERARSP